MPAKHSIPLQKELHALALVDAKQPLRKVSKIVGVPKSTLHDNLDNYRSDVERFERQHHRFDKDLAKDILSASMEGKTSSRDCAIILSRQKGYNVSHTKMLSVLSEMGTIAQKKNTKPIPLHSATNDATRPFAPLSAVKCGAFDEVFLKKFPILGFVDPVSAFIFLQDAPDRNAESWVNFLSTLSQMGLKLDSTVTDGGKGMLKGIGEIFPDAIRIRDLFHVSQKLSKGLKALEAYCYHLIRSYDKLKEKDDDKEKQADALSKMDKAIRIYDALSLECKSFQSACYFDHDSGYVNSTKTGEIMKRIIALIECADRNAIKHKKLSAAKSYLSGAKKDIVAYKATIETLVESRFGSANTDAVLSYICPIIEYLDQVQRSYENLKRKEYWEKKVVEARQRFRQFKFIDQNEVDESIDFIAQIMWQIKNSNSLIETVNSVIRRFLVTYKSIPSWFCSLLTFYWNCRRFKRGKRKGTKPIEVLTGKYSNTDWIDELLEGHVFEDKKSELSCEKEFALAS